MERTIPPDGGLTDVAVVLVGIQSAILLTSALEAAVSATFLGPTAIGPVALSGAAAAITAGSAVALGRRSRRARKWTLVAEGAVVAIALVDVVALPLLTGSASTLVAILTRLVVPLAVVGLLRRRPVRAAFAPVAS